MFHQQEDVAWEDDTRHQVEKESSEINATDNDSPIEKGLNCSVDNVDMTMTVMEGIATSAVLSIFITTCTVHVHRAIYTFICLSFHFSTLISIHPSIRPSIHLSRITNIIVPRLDG